MASIRKRPRSPFFHAAFTGSDGKKMWRSTMMADRSTANAIAGKFAHAAKLAKRDVLPEAKARRMLADMLEETEVGNTLHGQRCEEHFRATLNEIMQRAGHGEVLRSVSIEDHFRSWLDSKEPPNTEQSTYTTYSYWIDCFLKHMTKQNRESKPLTALSIRDVQRFMNEQAKKAPNTLIQARAVIRMALKQASKAGLIPTNPADAVGRPKAKGVEREAFTPTEVKLLVDAAKGEWKTLILLGYFTGARLSDCCRMAWESVDLAAQILTFTQGKNDKQITQPIHPELLELLNSLAGIDTPEKYVMPGMAHLKPGGRHGLSEGFKRIMRKAGVSAREVEGMGVRKQSKRSFHSLRHSFTSALANEGIPEEIRMKLTGHTTKAVHRGYTHHELETLRSAMNRLPSVG